MLTLLLRSGCFRTKSARKFVFANEFKGASGSPEKAGLQKICKPAFVCCFAVRIYSPLVPCGLPTPVTKSQPVVQLKLPAEPLTMSRKLLVPSLL
jgi:hypothetical protein